MVRPPAVAGTWYPGIAGALARDVDAYLDEVTTVPAGRIDAIIAPHAGLMFSGPVGSWAYRAAAASSGDPFEVAVLVGPSHFVPFEGVAVWPDGAFASPLGEARIDSAAAAALLDSPVVHAMPAAHRREHSLEMQLPFLLRLFPQIPIVPLLMGFQRRETIEALADALTSALGGRRALLVASTDLSHYFDATTAVALDRRVLEAITAFDPDGLLRVFEEYPEPERGRYVACGGGPAISVMRAARALGAREGRVLKYGHSGDISGDNSGVVGYAAGAFGAFSHAQ